MRQTAGVAALRRPRVLDFRIGVLQGGGCLTPRCWFARRQKSDGGAHTCCTPLSTIGLNALSMVSTLKPWLADMRFSGVSNNCFLRLVTRTATTRRSRRSPAAGWIIRRSGSTASPSSSAPSRGRGCLNILGGGQCISVNAVLYFNIIYVFLGLLLLIHTLFQA
jgi:hypothetical protein